MYASNLLVYLQVTWLCYHLYPCRLADPGH